MSQVDDLKQKSGFAMTTDDLKTKLESKSSNSATNSAISQAVEIKIEQIQRRQVHVEAKIQIPYPLEQGRSN